MKNLLLSAAILTVFATNANAMIEGEESCPSTSTLRKVVGNLRDPKDGSTFTVEEGGKKWVASNFEIPHSIVNLGTGAEPVFSAVGPTGCHVDFDKPIDTAAGKKTGVATILKFDLKLVQ